MPLAVRNFVADLARLSASVTPPNALQAPAPEPQAQRPVSPVPATDPPPQFHSGSVSNNPTQVDRDINHLNPVFRQKLLEVLAEVERATGEKWVLEEGLRSQARQTWLYAQGRTRPGAVVTWKKVPTWHGSGRAADVRPARGYRVPRSHWETLRQIYLRHGLDNPAWKNGDLGHIQLTHLPGG